MEKYEVTTEINWYAIAAKSTDVMIEGGFTLIVLFLVLITIFKVERKKVALGYSLVLTAICYVIQFVANEHIKEVRGTYLSSVEKFMTSFVAFVGLICVLLLGVAAIIYVIRYIVGQIKKK